MAGQSFSVCMYVMKAEGGTQQYFLTMGERTTRGALQAYFFASNQLRFGFYDPDVDTTSAYPSDVGVWVHWCFVFNSEGSTFAIYRDGVAQSFTTSGSASGTTSASGPLFLGVWKWSKGRKPFSGAMDEVRVFVHHALTQAELPSLMADPTTDAPGLVLALTFDAGAGDLGKDYSLSLIHI